MTTGSKTAPGEQPSKWTLEFKECGITSDELGELSHLLGFSQKDVRFKDYPTKDGVTFVDIPQPQTIAIAISAAAMFMTKEFAKEGIKDIYQLVKQWMKHRGKKGKVILYDENGQPIAWDDVD